MKVLLLQAQIYLPSLGGGNKANRRLLENLAARGHNCVAVGPAVVTRAGPTNLSEFHAEMAARNISWTQPEPQVQRYRYRGVEVDAVGPRGRDDLAAYLRRRMLEFRPDWILVADDKNKLLLECAIAVNARRVVPVLQTIVHLPFGPLALQACPHQTELFSRARAIVAISHYLRDFIRRHVTPDVEVVRLPVYGTGPFPILGRFDRGYVTLINPCPEKGMGIFLELAKQFSDVAFAAVPTWGADEEVLRALERAPNVTILESADEIEEILTETRVLIVPSLWHETFGYVVVEAMLHGIPVLASDIGGLREAKLGVDYLLPVTPATRVGGRYVQPRQDIGPWRRALAALLSDAAVYRRCSAQSRSAALNFVSSVDVASFESFLKRLSDRDPAGRPGEEKRGPQA